MAHTASSPAGDWGEQGSEVLHEHESDTQRACAHRREVDPSFGGEEGVVPESASEVDARWLPRSVGVAVRIDPPQRLLEGLVEHDQGGELTAELFVIGLRSEYRVRL